MVFLFFDMNTKPYFNVVYRRNLKYTLEQRFN